MSEEAKRDILVRLNMGRENAFPGGWAHNDYILAIAEITALRAALDQERERWEKALRLTWQMINPLKPAGTPGSYARGFDAGVAAALTTLRENALFSGRGEGEGHVQG